MAIPMLPPDVNEASAAFSATKEGIRFAMTGIKGVGGSRRGYHRRAEAGGALFKTL